MIKFRAWDICNNKMIYFNNLTSTFTNDILGSDNDYRLEAHRDFENKSFIYNHDDFNCDIKMDIEQYSSKKDCNGNLICHNDIIKFTNYKKVTYHRVKFNGCFFEVVDDTRGHSWRVLSFNESKYIEIVGNVHENKELLND